MLRVAQPRVARGPPDTGGAKNGSRRLRRPDGWEGRALLAAAGGLYFAAAEFAPLDRIDAWIDERFFWEPIALATIALLLVLAIAGHRQHRRLAGQLGASSSGAASEFVPMCVRCKAVHDENDCWEPIEAYLAHRTLDKSTRYLCPACLDHLAS